jgi:predicted MPP superfamily phosphohydrolase
LHTTLLVVLVRRLLLITFLALTQRFWFQRGWRLALKIGNPAWRMAARAFLAIAAAAIAAVLADRIFGHFLPRAAGVWIAPVVQLWIFASILAFLCVKVVHAVEWSWLRLTGRGGNREETAAVIAVDLKRRAFFRYAAGVAGGVPLLAAVYGFAGERLRYRIHRVEIPLANLPAALDGFRIVQFSDIHIGDFMPAEEIRRAVRMANELKPHLAVVTGDFVTSRGDPLAECVTELSMLRAPLGVWGCNGNHEIYAGVEAAAAKLFYANGMHLLRQARAELDWRGEKINLIGVDYERNVGLSGLHMPALRGIEPLVRPEMPNVLLAHNPNSFYRAADLGIDLTLSGHTHGGQIKFEIVDHSWSPAKFMTRFTAGRFQLPMVSNGGAGSNRQAFLYVNRGLGTIAIPARLGVEPEITLLTLRATSPNRA